MSSFFSTSEIAGISKVLSGSFDTWAREVIIYKDIKRVETSPTNPNNNLFGFGEDQQEPIYTYLPPDSGRFMAIIKDSDILSSKGQRSEQALAPEIMVNVVSSPISIKVKQDAYDFIEDGETKSILDVLSNELYILDGHPCLQTFVGTKYYVYSLRKTN